jgi:hypothetical protein
MKGETRGKRLNKKNALPTPGSVTTNLINYSDALLKLEVEFKGGGVYHYLEVEPEKWEEYKDWVLSGESSGWFVNKKIKGLYDEVKIA